MLIWKKTHRIFTEHMLYFFYYLENTDDPVPLFPFVYTYIYKLESGQAEGMVLTEKCLQMLSLRDSYFLAFLGFFK